MAIYKNREVTLEHVLEGSVNPARAIIMYENGARENVKLVDVVVTEDEKKRILDAHTDGFENQVFVLDENSETYKTIKENKKQDLEFERQSSPEAAKRDLVKTDEPKAKKTK